MKITLAEAYTSLKLPYGASFREVELKYNNLAYHYHVHGCSKKLERIFCAYQRIVNSDGPDEVVMDMEIMRDLFKNIFKAGGRNGVGFVEDGDDSFSESDFSDDEYGDRHRYRDNYEGLRLDDVYGAGDEAMASSLAMAKELISEEEKEKRKAEKRRAKKKKRREKKKLEKEQGHLAAMNGGEDGRNDTPNGIRSSDEGEGIDPNAAFVKKSNKKKSEVAPASTKIENTSVAGHSVADKQNEAPDPGENSSVNTKKSRVIANKGNLAAHNGDYPEAISQFSEAIKLEPSDYRFYGNRSYCYDRIMQFDKALLDADKCIELSSDWPKGYFRRGRALAGLKLYADAEKAFMHVLKLDKSCEEAAKELNRVRTQQLIDMGFSAKDSEQAVIGKNSTQEALDELLANGNAELAISADDVYVSDDEDERVNSVAPTTASAQKIANTFKSKSVKPSSYHNSTETFTEEKKMDPTNPEGLTALWVGNVLPTVSEAELQELFSRYGHVSSVRCLPEKFCAFVNFKSKEAAGKAMNALQDFSVQGQKLLIKFPDNPIAQAQAKQARQAALSTRPPVKEKRERPLAGPATKVSGPVNGDECYYWRTTGCQFGNKCRHKHIPESRGVDRKPWHRVK